MFFCFRISVFFYLVAKFKKQMIINNFLLRKEDRKVENHSVNLDWNILYSKPACHSWKDDIYISAVINRLYYEKHSRLINNNKNITAKI